MSKYNCLLCNYITENKTNYEKHNKTKKHITNTKKQYMCKKCNIIYSCKATLQNHKCKNKTLMINLQKKHDNNSSTRENMENLTLEQNNIIIEKLDKLCEEIYNRIQNMKHELIKNNQP